MNKQQQDLLDVLTSKHSNLYDYICDNYYLLTREELKDLCKEVIALLYVYASRANPNSEKANREMHAELLENIKEYTTFFEE